MNDPRIGTRTVGALLLASLLAPVPATAATLSVEVQARTIAPGEPLRVRVVSDAPLATLTGKLLGHEVALRPDGDSKRWSGWAMIGLDEAAGQAGIEIRGTDRDGNAVGAGHVVTIEAREFPEERLEVSSRYVEPPAAVQERLERERTKLTAIYDTRSAGPGGERPFVRPVPGAPTSIFGMRRFFNDQPRDPHPGLDLRAASGTPVVSSGPGTVVLAQELYYAGNTVIVDHGGGLFTIYAHLSEIRVVEHESAQAGQVVGLSGATGRVTGPHLHWGAKIGNRPFDPTALVDEALWEPTR